MTTTTRVERDRAAEFQPERRRLLGRTAGLGLIGLGGGLLGGCGGSGVGSNGTGSPVLLSQSVGTVSGFGSVVVDGVRRDDSAARVERERADGGRDSAEMRLGQRVVLEYSTDAAGAEVLGRIEVRPSLVGRVSERTADTLGVLGQTVVINADPTRGPITVLGERWRSAADIALGEAVELHAIVTGAPGGTRRLLATRIDTPSALDTLRLVAPVSEVLAARAGTSRQQVRVGALTVWLPAGDQAQAGQMLTLHASPADFDAATLVLRASRMQIDAASTLVAAGSRIERAGLIAGWSGRSLTIDGITVEVDAATVLKPATLLPADGLHARVVALRSSDALRWQAVSIEAVATTGSALLVGTLSDWSAATADSPASFRVRDTWVTLSAATALDLGNCAAAAATATLVNGMHVEVTGSVGSRGIVADRVRCLKEPQGTSAQLTRQGRILSFDVPARRLTLQQTAEDGSLREMAVSWSETTHWRDPVRGSAALLATLAAQGQLVEIEGTLSSDGLLQARRVRLHPSADQRHERSPGAPAPGGSSGDGVSRVAGVFPEARAQARSSTDTLQRCQSAS
ncbi:hypothetical protein X805_38350 [Sphaerotilus natans subsp. natans DSM 6575]|uniref:DUF5666 domain-containing protein n=1 Tax=Sphaerotilus natans subsp. natans DSM 6575 TaxID=1286631 RepID=A0A059KGL7_9BURK|nr:DUF5666 domain-containing protein [Sphaerotilus natans]KDB50576.1 hypothetical protein X805_38350 [Sphaerotilus natans subsp. natans DSM 6575]SIQ83065.1 hypothetical protein SAMN05421778_10516 [Sphaerotilus natans]